MIGFLRLGIFGLIALVMLYGLASWYSRSVRREYLEKRADRDIADGTLEPTARTDYIEAGMHAYENSLRKKLLLGIIVVPIMAVGVITYMTNFM